jgi:hypothetical protein
VVEEVWVYGKTKTIDDHVTAEVAVTFAFENETSFRVISRGSAPLLDGEGGEQMASAVAMTIALESVADRVLKHAQSIAKQTAIENQIKLF